MFSPKKGAAGSAPAAAKGPQTASSVPAAATPVRSSASTQQAPKTETKAQGAARGATPPSPGGTQASSASPKQQKGAYESPHSPIASATKSAGRQSGRVPKPKLAAAPPASPASPAPVKNGPGAGGAAAGGAAPRKLVDTPGFSGHENGTAASQPVAVPAASVAHGHAAHAASASSMVVGQPGSAGLGAGAGAGAGTGETKNETIFSPAYLRHLEAEAEKAAEAKRASAAAAAQPKAAAGKKAAAKPKTAAGGGEVKTKETAAAAPAAAAPAAAPAPAVVVQPVKPPQAEAEDMDDDYALDEEEFDPFVFIKNLPPLSPAMRNRKSPLPKKSKKAPPITLALDLDETLVHCSVQHMEKHELTFDVNFNGVDYQVYVRLRPHLKTFLETVSQWFEIIVFTASQKVYADKLLNILDPKHEYIKHRVFRDSCVCIDGNYLKDLHILGRELKKTAIVDNSVQAFGFQLDNGIPIESWFDDDNDCELLNLLPFLKTLKDVQDVRPLIRQTFRLQEFVNSL